MSLLKTWDALPTPIKIIVYFALAGILNLEAQRLMNIRTTPELTIIFQAIANILLWITQNYLKS